MQTLWVASAVAACAGQLFLAMLALRKGGRGPLAIRLALLCLDLFTWHAASVAHDLWGHEPSRFIDYTMSPLTTPLAFEFIVAFVGKRRSLLWLRKTLWYAFGALGFAPTVGLFWTRAHDFPGSQLWAAIHLAALFPVMAFGAFLLAQHLRKVGGDEERARTKMVLLALAVGTVLGSTEMWSNLAHEVPSMGALGLLAASGLLTLAVTRFHLLEGEKPVRAVIWTIALVAFSAMAWLALLEITRQSLWMLWLAGAILPVAMVIATRQLAIASAVRRARVTQLATLGRFSAQLAHDLKNPLAALKGATQVLEEELKTGPRAELCKLMLEQVDRLQRAIDGYQRLSRVEAVRAPLVVNDLVRQVLALQPFVSERVAVSADLADGLPLLDGDRDLLATALENLMRNAFEAIPGQGRITVRTTLDDHELLLDVEDTGAGMDARHRERAFEEFYSTKSSGSGLGLPFVRRVAEVHGGEVALSSEEGRGTVVRLRLPVG